MTTTAPHHILRDPKPGELVRTPPAAGWRSVPAAGAQAEPLAGRGPPAHLVPLEVGDHGSTSWPSGRRRRDPHPLRLVRSRVDRPGSGEVRDLLVQVG